MLSLDLHDGFTSLLNLLLKLCNHLLCTPQLFLRLAQFSALLLIVCLYIAELGGDLLIFFLYIAVFRINLLDFIADRTSLRFNTC